MVVFLTLKMLPVPLGKEVEEIYHCLNVELIICVVLQE